MAGGAAAGGSSGSGAGGDPRPSVSASAKSARHAVLLAVQAVSVNAAAVREAQEDREAIQKGIGSWRLELYRARYLEPRKRWRLQAGDAGRTSVGSIGGTFDGSGSTDGPGTTSAERARQALLLVAQVMGVSAAGVREARAECDLVAMDALGLPVTSRAARAGDIDRLRLLLEAGADTEQTDGEGWTPLFWAVVGSGEGTDCLRLLLEAGADANKVANGGKTALNLAAKIGDDRNAG